MTSHVDAVLFDMGGVLVQLSPLDRQLDVQGMTSDEFWDRWLTSAVVRSLERGECDVDRFAAGLIEEFELRAEPAEVIARFAAVPQGLFPGAAEMVEALDGEVVTGLLSNTNEVHWRTQPDAERIESLFDRHYVSYQLGLMKPDREIFDHVVSDLALPAERILFIDDNQINVDGARAAGLRAEVAKGPEAATAVLGDYGLVSCG